MIYPPDLKIGSVYQSVKFDVPVQCTIEDFRCLDALREGAELDWEHIDVVFKPIRLTIEILEKNFGFKFKKKKPGTQGVYTNGRINLNLSNSGNIYHNRRPMPYVHTLQNYYYELYNVSLKWIDL